MPTTTNGQATTSTTGMVEVPWNLVVPTVDVHVVGCGNRFPNDFTLEMLAVLRQCTRRFGVPPLHAPEFGIPDMESLMHLYGPDKPRHQTYREMLDTVLTAAAAEPPVAFVTYGSAMVGTFVAHRILEETAKRGMTAHVTNAVSCFDGIWADLNLEPFYGIEVWEASGFVRLGIHPNTAANLLLPQAPMFDIPVGPDPDRLTMATSTSITELRDHLMRFYPADHTVHYVKTGSGAGSHLVGADIETIALADLNHPGRQQASTLFVPRLPIANLKRFDFTSPATTATQPN